jgi:hypothetical protein
MPHRQSKNWENLRITSIAELEWVIAQLRLFTPEQIELVIYRYKSKEGLASTSTKIHSVPLLVKREVQQVSTPPPRLVEVRVVMHAPDGNVWFLPLHFCLHELLTGHEVYWKARETSLTLARWWRRRFGSTTERIH